MRLAFLIRHFDPKAGGAERYAYEVVNHLRRHHDCHVMCIRHVPMDGVTFHVHAQPWRRPTWMALLRYAAWAHAEVDNAFDAVMSNENVGFGDVQMVHVRPVRHDLFHSTYSRALRNLVSTIFSPRLWAYLMLEAFRLRDRPGRSLVAPSHLTAHQLIQELGCKPHCVHALLPAVSRLVDPQGTKAHRPWRPKLGLHDNSWLLLMVAHDLEKKGLPLVLSAMTEMPNDVHLLVTGSVSIRSKWTNTIESLALQHRVHWLEPQEDLASVYASADVLVHPTRADVYGMVILEAMGQGLPVVCTKPPHCGAAWGWSHTHQAWLLDSPDDRSGLIQGVMTLKTDLHLRQTLIASGLAEARQNSWEQVASKIVSLLEEARQVRISKPSVF